MAFSRERRAHIARKYYYIDGLTTSEIQERFEERGIASLATSTISTYLNEGSAEETKRQVRDRMADEDIRMVESLQRKHDRAREAEQEATEREEVVAMAPEYEVHNVNDPITVRDWRALDVDEYPPEATRYDTRIEFLEESRTIYRGETFPLRGPDGEPIYKPRVVAVQETDARDEESFLRREQAGHLDQIATLTGHDDDTITVEHEGSLDVEHSVPEELIEAVVGAAHHRLDENVSKNREDDENGNGADDDSET